MIKNLESERLKSQLKRIAGAAHLSEECENLALGRMRTQSCSELTIITELMLAGIERLDSFDMGTLAEIAECSEEELKELFYRSKSRKIKITKSFAEQRIKSMKQEISEPDPQGFRAKQIRRCKEA
ncbi:hypothetical protein KY328_01025, partial [Candidatus Woesearchaeota archaeon]|nr:hypothetical protein [Candidatus Woesearchaeota archaeon]